VVFHTLPNTYTFYSFYLNVLAYFQVNLIREFQFRNSGQTYSGIPVMVANMDTTGTFEMAKAMGKVAY